MLKNVSKLFLISCILFSCSCTAKRVELPVYEGTDVREALSSKNNISSVDSTFSIIFEKDDSEIRGDGVVNMSRNGNMTMRIYSFGFLAFEITAENGFIKSAPAVDRNKSTILTYGLRDCIFWWDMEDFEIEEKEDYYIIRNLTRTLWLDRKTMFPKKQIISLEEGRQLNIYYENPEKAGDIWYPSRIRIELSKYAVTLKIKDISFILNAQTKINHNSIYN
jgi:outer membrane lipoprotein-sorting protein